MDQAQAANSFRYSFCFWVILLLLLPLIAGCARAGGLSWRGEAPTEKTHTEPFSPAGFYDLLIPSELTWSREKSMVVRTKSFAGGVLYFSGRVDINSLVDYFTTTMPRNNWRLVGSAQDRNVMLVFIKPHKNATIVIGRADLTGRTEVQIHITDDLSQGQKSRHSAPARPFAF